jgi:Outer membrane protein beta-barrel domain
MKKKVIFISLALLYLIVLSVSARAQKASAIVRAGINFANVSVTNSGNVDDAKMLTSFQAGIIADLPFGKFVSLQPGLLFTGKGSKTQSGDPSEANYYKATTNPYYIEIPATLVLKAPIGDEAHFFAGAGPYLAIGIAGKNKVEGKYLGVGFNSEDDIQFSDDDPSTLNYEEGAGFGIMKRFDYGLNGTAGIEGKSTVLSVNYGLGLAKLQSGSNSSDNNNNKHRVFSITLGFKL